MNSLMTSLNVRVNAKNKEKASKILDDLGLNMTTAINLFLAQIIKKDGIPFEIKNYEPNEELKYAIKEGNSILDDITQGKRNGYNNMKDLIDSLDED